MNKKTKKSSKKNETMKPSFIDSLNLEETAKQLDDLKAIIFTTTETNQAKIQFIKEELLAGRYEIRSDRIADKLLEYAKIEEIEEIEPELA